MPRAAAPVVALALALSAATAAAQDDADALVVPPPPGTAPAPDALDEPIPTPTPPDSVPPPPAPDPTAAQDAVRPLVDAAEADLAANRAALALARTSVAIVALPEGAPLRIRAEGLRLLAQQRLPENATAPPTEEVYAPLVAQAELDLRMGRAPLAVPRLDLALSRLPAGTPLRARAEQLRAAAAQIVGAPPLPPPPAAVAPPAEITSPRDPTRRGTGEIVELYITAAFFGSLSGGYIPFVASNGTANDTVYTLTLIGGAGLLAVGVLTLDLSAPLRTGVAPTISESIRVGFVNGMLAWSLAAMDGRSARTQFTLVWSGAALGLATGLAVGFGVEPSVRDARFVESTALWGGVLGTAVALMTDYQDPVAGVLLSLVGLDAGLLAGILTAATGEHPSTARTLFLDLGFLAGTGAGAFFPSLYYFVSRTTPEALPIGVGMAVGAIGGWLIAFLATDGMDAARAREDEPAPVHAAIAPVEGGGVLTLTGAL